MREKILGKPAEEPNLQLPTMNSSSSLAAFRLWSSFLRAGNRRAASRFPQQQQLFVGRNN